MNQFTFLIMLNPSNFAVFFLKRRQSLPFRWLIHIHARRGIVAQSVNFAWCRQGSKISFYFSINTFFRACQNAVCTLIMSAVIHKHQMLWTQHALYGVIHNAITCTLSAYLNLYLYKAFYKNKKIFKAKWAAIFIMKFF